MVYLQCLVPLLVFTILVCLPSSSHTDPLLFLCEEEMETAVKGTPRCLNYQPTTLDGIPTDGQRGLQMF